MCGSAVSIITFPRYILPVTGSTSEAVPNDFAVYVQRTLTDSEKLDALDHTFKPHRSYTFPVRMEYGKRRSINPAWLEEYKWLTYSSTEDGVYCKVCVVFAKHSNPIRLVTLPLTFWTNATEKLRKHATSQMHKNASVFADNFIRVMKSQQKSIGEQMSEAVALQVESNKKKLQPIVKTILFCGRQNIPLRGHRESSDSKNPGNFRALLKFRVDSGDDLLKDHLENAPKNATYISNTIQNEIIVIVGELFQKKILEDVHAGSNVFALIADESRDCSNKEQMALIIRYVDQNKMIQETFLGFVECPFGTTGEELGTLIKSSCTAIGLDLNLCRAQGYDGASNMSGECKGAAGLLRRDYPKALYFHCASHKLNLCVANSCQLRSVANMMGMITSFANFFNYSPKRQKSLEDHVKRYPDASKSKLIPLCRTRWVERINALEVTIDLIDAITDTFSEMMETMRTDIGTGKP